MKRGLTIAVAALLCLTPVGAASGAMVVLPPLVLRADGGLAPHRLPRRGYAPVHFSGHADISTTTGAQPPALRWARIDIDRDVRAAVRGLPVCTAARIEGTTVKQARRRCHGAIVGTGQVEATVALPGHEPVDVRSPLTVFNGPPRGGAPTALAHARASYPVPQTYVTPVRIQRRGGNFGYRASFAVPEIAEGYGSLTHVDLRIARRYRYRGRLRSYLYARCTDGIFETRGRFGFADGTIIDGVVFRTCAPRR